LQIVDFAHIGHETYLNKSVGDGLVGRKTLAVKKVEGDAVFAEEVR
jgi:hypothetical protein